MVNTMEQQKSCQDCYQKHDCQKVYGQLGRSDGSSIVLRVIIAFLLPIVIFIIFLAISEKIFSGFGISERFQPILSFSLSLLVTFIYLLFAKFLDKRLGRKIKFNRSI